MLDVIVYGLGTYFVAFAMLDFVEKWADRPIVDRDGGLLVIRRHKSWNVVSYRPRKW